ncbi:hypothetical protein AAC387_Pa02g0196 [Persea americana]
MGENEPVVAQTTMDYPSVGYASDYSAADPAAAAADGSAYMIGTSGDSTSSVAPTEAVYALPDGSSLGDGNVYNMDPSSVPQDGPLAQNYDTKLLSVGATASSNAENGNVSNDAGGPVVEQQFEEGSAISTEEDRLWSIVRANSLDFNAWTALIQETEKLAEDNILKTRKVYDAFLAEFPLCYGYWKKYADHEARLGTIEKVVEVYERSVQAVTYSVDIWLHYCMFAISTYGDPDTVRSVPHMYGGRFAGDAL